MPDDRGQRRVPIGKLTQDRRAHLCGLVEGKAGSSQPILWHLQADIAADGPVAQQTGEDAFAVRQREQAARTHEPGNLRLPLRGLGDVGADKA